MKKFCQEKSKGFNKYEIWVNIYTFLPNFILHVDFEMVLFKNLSVNKVF